jgi:hypothetical protein
MTACGYPSASMTGEKVLKTAEQIGLEGIT